MKNMTKALCAALLFAAPIPAFAQGIAVHDSANLIQQINAVRQAIQVVAQGKQQIQEAQKLYQDLNKLTDIPQLAQQLKSDALRELDLSGGSLEGFGNGNLDVVGAGRAKADAVPDLERQILEQANRRAEPTRACDEPGELEHQLARADDQRPDAGADQRAAQDDQRTNGHPVLDGDLGCRRGGRRGGRGRRCGDPIVAGHGGAYGETEGRCAGCGWDRAPRRRRCRRGRGRGGGGIAGACHVRRLRSDDRG